MVEVFLFWLALPSLLKVCNVLGVGTDYMLVDSLTASHADILSLNVLNDEDRQCIQVIIREFVRYKTNLMLTLK